jgi:hypothetical protein
MDIVRKEKEKAYRQKFYVKTDSIVIAIDDEDTAKYAAQKINEVIDHFPTLYDNIPKHPDLSYAESGYWRKFTDSSSGEEKTLSFGSEVGQDNYYMLYAYFLRQINKEKGLAGRRDTLTRIYRDLNSIFGHMVYGGTYFGHQYRRIIGYVEYDLYLGGFPTESNMAKQKRLYLDLLRQKITDQIEADDNILMADKDPMKRAVFEKVTEIEKLITDQCYLENAIAFQYMHY